MKIAKALFYAFGQMTDIHDAGPWLLGLAAGFGLLAISGSLGIRLRISTIPGYLLGGVLLGAWFDIPQIFLHITTTLGAMLILFFVGLGFSPSGLGKRLKNLTIPSLWDALINIILAFAAALLLNMGLLEAAIFALAVYASSSAVVAKGLMDNKLLTLPETDLCLGILVVEDLMMALLLPLCVLVLQAGPLQFVGGEALTLAIGFMLLMLVILLARRGMLTRWLSQPANDLTLLASLALLCLIAGIGETSGVSAAVGALLAGMIVADSDSKKHIEAMLMPHRELLAVGFFAAIGAGSDWQLILAYLPIIIPLMLVTSSAKIFSGYLGAKSQGLKRESCFRLGLMLTPRGEFTLVVAALATSQVWGKEFYNMMVAYVFLSAIAGSIAIRYNATLSRKLASIFSRSSFKQT